jgi:hypothetical protein
MSRTLLIAMLVCLFPVCAWGDWDPGDAAKWAQLPDAGPNGVAVCVTRPFIVADDFLCTQSGPITAIHVWGEWWDDHEGPLVYNGFHVYIYSDVPAGPSGSYSRPGALLWSGTFHTDLNNISRRQVATSPEPFYDPQLQTYVGTQEKLWQYNLTIDPQNAFIQQEGTTYWLGIQEYLTWCPFGWKTSSDHWNDAAVWQVGGTGGPEEWNPLQYPSGHPLQGQNMDFAFVIVPEPSGLLLLAAGGLAALRRRTGG